VLQRRRDGSGFVAEATLKAVPAGKRSELDVVTAQERTGVAC
jgi:hypothetical protein